MSKSSTKLSPPKKSSGTVMALVVGVILIAAAIVIAARLSQHDSAATIYHNNMEAQVEKIPQDKRPPLDPHFLDLVREATAKVDTDRPAAIEAGKEAIAALDASRDAARGALYRAEISLVIVRAAKASGDRDDQTTYAKLGETSFNQVLTDSKSRPADKAQAKADLAQLKALSE